MESSDTDEDILMNPRAGLRKQVPLLPNCDESIAAPTCSSYLSNKSQKLKSKLSLSQKQRQADSSFKKDETSFLKKGKSPNYQNGKLHAKCREKTKFSRDKSPVIPAKKSRQDTMLSSSSEEEILPSQSKIQKRIVRRSDMSPMKSSSLLTASPRHLSTHHPVSQSPIKCKKGKLCENISSAHHKAYNHVESDSVESGESSVISLNFPPYPLTTSGLNENVPTGEPKVNCNVQPVQSPTTFSASGETKEDFVQHWVDSLEICETEKIVHSSDEETQPLIIPEASSDPIPNLQEPILSDMPFKDNRDEHISKHRLDHVASKRPATNTSSHNSPTQPLLIEGRDSDISTDIPSSLEDYKKKKTPKKADPAISRGMVTPRRKKELQAKPTSSSGKQTAITAYYTPSSNTPDKSAPEANVFQVQKNTSINELSVTIAEKVETVMVEQVGTSNPIENAKEKWSYIMSRMNMRGTATNLEREIKQAKAQKAFKEPKQQVNSNRYNGEEAGSSTERKCPFYKRIPGTGFAIDAFCYGRVKGVSSYFLSHFHYDHYRGLGKWLDKPLYCSQVTANLVNMKIKPNPHLIKVLPLNESVVIENVEVILIDANHCPGSSSTFCSIFVVTFSFSQIVGLQVR